jgi:hypothetical protein
MLSTKIWDLSEQNPESPVSEVLSAKELEKLCHERRRDNVRKRSNTANHYDSWDLSGGLLGI